VSYQTGKLGVAAGTGLVFVVIMPRLFLTTTSTLVAEAGQAAWIPPILAGMYGLLMLWVLFYVSSRVPGDLFAIAKTLIGSVGAWLIALLFIFFSFVNAVSLLRQLAECTLITAMPEADIHVVILFYGATVAIIVHYGIEPIARAAYLLMPFIVLGLSVSIALLTPYFDIHFLLPWQGNGLPAIFKTSLVIGGSNFEALVLVALAPAFQRIRTMKKAALFGLGGAAVIKTVFTVAYLLIFDVETGIEKTLPYYEMARLIYINRYVQRVEALLIVLWVVAGLMATAISLYIGMYFLTRLLNLPTMRPLIPAVCLIVLQLSLLPKSLSDTIQFDKIVLLTGAFGIYVLPPLLLAATFFKGRRAKKCAAE